MPARFSALTLLFVSVAFALPSHTHARPLVTDTEAPVVTIPAPTGLTATNGACGTINITWNAVTAATAGYTLFDDQGTGVKSVVYTGMSRTFSHTVTPGTLHRYTVEASGVGDSIPSQPVSETAAACGAPPTVSLTGLPSSIVRGSSATLSWSVQNIGTAQCAGTGGWSGAKASLGTETVTPSVTTTYTLVCSGSSGFDSKSVTVTVTEPPQPTPAPTPTPTPSTPPVSTTPPPALPVTSDNLLANPTQITLGGAATLSWDFPSLTSSSISRWCTASGGWSGSRPLSGTEVVRPTNTTTYTLQCQAQQPSGGMSFVTKSVTVTVNQPAPTPAPTPAPSTPTSPTTIPLPVIFTFEGVPTTIKSGESAILVWNLMNSPTAECTASGAWTGLRNTTGTLEVTPRRTGTYTLSCLVQQPSGGMSTLTKSVTITVSGTVPSPTTPTVPDTPPTPTPTPTPTLTPTPVPAPTPTPAPAPASAKFKNGDRVTTTDNLSVRPNPTTGAARTFTRTAGSIGTVSNGPVSADGYTWWYVKWDAGGEGWSVENYLALVTVTPTPAPTPAPTPTPTPSTPPVSTTPPPALPVTGDNLLANPTEITLGGAVTLSWNFPSLTSSSISRWCTASDGWSGSRPLSGTEVVRPTYTTTYKIQCQAQLPSGGMSFVNKSVTVNVIVPQAPTFATSTAFAEWREAGTSGGTAKSASTRVTLSSTDLVSEISTAQAAGDPIGTVLGNVVAKSTAKSGYTFVDNTLTYTAKLAPQSANLSYSGCKGDQDCNKLVDGLIKVPSAAAQLGKCTLPIPGGSLNNARTGEGTLTATIKNDDVALDLISRENNTTLSFGISVGIDVKADVGLEWCGTNPMPSCKVEGPNPACPQICVPVPNPKWYNPANVDIKCSQPLCSLPNICLVPDPVPKLQKEPWTDWSTFTVKGAVKGGVKLSLDHSLNIGSDGVLRINGGAKFTGTLDSLPRVYFTPVRPDTRLISTALGPVPHVVTSPVLQTLIDHVNLPLALTQTFNLDEKILNGEIEKALKKQEDALNARLKANPIEVRLPTYDPNKPDSVILHSLVLNYLRSIVGIIGEAAIDIVDRNFTKILYYMLTENNDAIKALFTQAEMCPAIEGFKTPMNVLPLYMKSGSSCTQVNPRTAASGTYYSDTSCTKAVSYQPGEFARLCKEGLGSNTLNGDTTSWSTLGVETDPLSTLGAPASKWSLSAGAQLGLMSIVPTDKNSIPYMKRIAYKNVNGCSLEMRVYKKNPNGTGDKPLLWIHGGKWSLRSPFIGSEMLFSHYTEAGFTVFAPFYRLTGNEDGPIQCRNASWRDMAADVDSALTWVESNSGTFGAPNTGKIAVAGQSAGGHLAAWLVAKRPFDVERALLVYAPLDFTDFMKRDRNIDNMSFSPIAAPENSTTEYNSSDALAIVKQAFQITDPKTEPLSSAPVVENSFADIIKARGQANFPPVFLIHGGADALVHSSQSDALCRAYGGTQSPSVMSSAALQRITCGSKSQYLFLREAGHMFEVCPASGAGSGDCAAGWSSAGKSAAQTAIGAARSWLLQN